MDLFPKKSYAEAIQSLTRKKINQDETKTVPEKSTGSATPQLTKLRRKAPTFMYGDASLL